MEQIELKAEIVPASPAPNGAAIQPVTTLSLIEIAVRQNASIEYLKQLMDMRDREEAFQARKAFDDAMAQFKAESIVVLKDKTNTQYDSKYVSLGNLIATVTPFLSKHGLSHAWEIDQTAGIKVVCILTHKMGHSKSASINFPPDNSGKKNPLQEIKSAITYAKAVTFESVTGLAASDANVDDDGNGASECVLDNTEDWLETIKQSSSMEELERKFKEAYRAAGSIGDEQSQNAFIAAKDKRKQELRNGNNR